MERTEMKKMQYTGNGESELLYYAKDDEGYGIAVVNTRGSHPCGYITFPGIENVHDYDNFCPGKEYPNGYAFYDIDQGAHYGYTYLGGLEAYGIEGKWIGWDYAHLGDWRQAGLPEDDVKYGIHREGDRKWTTQEIAQCALMQILTIKLEGFRYWEEKYCEEE